jgi:hydrogenase maturation protease
MSGSAPPSRRRRVLLLGFGNPGRLDDGLGQALVDRIAARGIEGVTAEVDYQLQIEHAAQAAEHDVVVFADADAAGPEPFSFRRLSPDGYVGVGFTTHALPPTGVLGVAREHLGAEVEGWMLGIRGYEFNEFGEGLSDAAEANLAAAVEFLDPLLRTRSFHEIPAATDGFEPRLPPSVVGS